MIDTQFNNLHTGRNGRGIVTVAIDMPGRRYNVFDESLLTEFESLVTMLERDVDTRVVAFTSAKEAGFLAGADIRQIAGLPRTCRNLVELFFQRERARKGDTWVSGHGAPSPPDHQAIGRVGVIGAGVMGAGIAQLAAYQGFQVVLKDVDDAAVAAGMNQIRKLLDNSVAKGQLPENDAAARLQAVMPTIDWQSFEDVDVAIEAVVALCRTTRTDDAVPGSDRRVAFLQPGSSHGVGRGCSDA